MGPEYSYCSTYFMHTAPTFYIHEDILFLIHYFYIGILELILIFIYDSYDSLVHEYTSSYYAYSSTTLVLVLVLQSTEYPLRVVEQYGHCPKFKFAYSRVLLL